MRKLKISALIFGLAAAALGVCAQALWGIHPPQAYGICIVCHGRDLIASLLEAVPGYPAEISVIGKRGLMLTGLMLPLGAFIAALIFREFHPGFREGKLSALLCGAAVMYCGLTLSGCPMRLLLRAGYGDLPALWLIAVVVLGVYCGTAILKRRAGRG